MEHIRASLGRKPFLIHFSQTPAVQATTVTIPILASSVIFLVVTVLIVFHVVVSAIAVTFVRIGFGFLVVNGFNGFSSAKS